MPASASSLATLAASAAVAGSKTRRAVSRVSTNFGGGCVYTLRDVTNERALEHARSDFVATASHELRTPLAAVYGAVRTLRRRDVDIGAENRAVTCRTPLTSPSGLKRVTVGAWAWARSGSASAARKISAATRAGANTSVARVLRVEVTRRNALRPSPTQGDYITGRRSA